jgi:hypothetical protein
MYSWVFDGIPTCVFSFADKHDRGLFHFKYKNGDIWEVQFTENEGELNYEITCCTSKPMKPLPVDIFDFERDMSKDLCNKLNLLDKYLISHCAYEVQLSDGSLDDFYGVMKLQNTYSVFVHNVFQIWENECVRGKAKAESDNTPVAIDISIKTDLNHVNKFVEEYL